MNILKRIVSIDCFYEYCKNGCPFFEEDSNKHKYYCHLDKTRKWFWNSWKKRIIFCDFVINYKRIKCKCIMCKDICKKIHTNKQDKEKEDYNDFSEGFCDYLNDGKTTTYNDQKDALKNYKNYIEGYIKAMMIKKRM